MCALPGWTWGHEVAVAALNERNKAQRSGFIAPEWRDNFESLVSLAINKDGIGNVKNNDLDPDGRPVGHWATAQRSRRATLRPRQVELLESIPDWSWDGMAARDARRWKAAYERLLSYVTETGTAVVPHRHTSPDGYGLGGWVSRQRHPDAPLTDEQRTLLEALPGWSWRMGERLGPRAKTATKGRRDQAWERMRQRVEDFYTTHRRYPYMKEKGGPEGKSVGGWVVSQRQLYRQGTIDPGRAVRLEATPGWVWEAQRGAAARGTSLVDLFNAGRVVPGDELVITARKWSHGRGVVTPDGRIAINGVVVSTPTEAEVVVTGRTGDGGWTFWGLKRDGHVTSLREVRDGFERDQQTRGKD